MYRTDFISFINSFNMQKSSDVYVYPVTVPNLLPEE